jgi:prevent-host-death family protein
MDTNIPIGEFKTHLYQLLDEAQKNNNQLIITRRGSAIAKIIPINIATKNSMLGMMSKKAEIKGDIINSLDVKWDAEIE